MEDRTPPTLKEMATRLGLNVGTISRALTGHPKVKAQTREQVLKLAEELNYRPNRSARKLVQGQRGHRFVAVLMPTIPHPFFFEVLKGLVEVLTPSDANLMIFNEGTDRSEVVDRILDEAPDGMLLFGNQPTDRERERIRQSRVPFLTVDCFDAHDHGVYLDNIVGGGFAADYLVSRGVRRPAYIGTRALSPQQTLRLKGFQDTLSRSGIDEVFVAQVDGTPEGAEAATRELISSRDCDGIFFFCDEMAWGGLKALEAAHEELPVVGYDDLPASTLLGLTTIRQDGPAMGKAAGEMVLGLMNDAAQSLAAPRKLVRLEPEFIRRRT